MLVIYTVKGSTTSPGGSRRGRSAAKVQSLLVHKGEHGQVSSELSKTHFPQILIQVTSLYWQVTSRVSRNVLSSLSLQRRGFYWFRKYRSRVKFSVVES